MIPKSQRRKPLPLQLKVIYMLSWITWASCPPNGIFNLIAQNAGATRLGSTLDYVVSRLENDDFGPISVEAPISLSFRLCMANVLISACQKIANSQKRHLARKTVPALIRSSEVSPSDIWQEIFFWILEWQSNCVLRKLIGLAHNSFECSKNAGDKRSRD